MHYGALQRAITMGFTALRYGRQVHNCKTKPNYPKERQIIMVHSFDLLKHFFSSWTVGNYLSRTDNSLSSKHWTFATGELFVKDRLTFHLANSKLEKNKKSKKLATDSLCQGQVCVQGEMGTKCRQLEVFKRWVPASIQLCCHHSGGERLWPPPALHLPLPFQTANKSFIFLFFYY